MPNTAISTLPHRRSRRAGQVDSRVIPLFSSIDGFLGWYAADMITGLSDGDPVATWPDLSGHSNDLLQGTSGQRPLYKLGQCNGLPGVDFDATDDSLVSPFSSLGSTFTLFIVYAPKTGTSAAYRALSGGGNNWLVGPFNGTNRYYNGGFIGSGAVSAGVFHYYTVAADGTGAAFYKDSALDGTNTGTLGPSTLYLGYNPTNQEPANSVICEVLVYNKRLADSDITTVQNYLASKYNLT